MRLTVLGLGRMGLPIARRLARRHEVTAFDPTLDRPHESGIRLAADAVEACSGAEILVTVLPGPGELRAAMDEPSVLGSQPLWIDMTSCDPHTGTLLHDQAAKAGSLSVGAPMRGGPEDARSGQLGFYLAGDAGAVDAVAPVLDELGPHDARQVVGRDPGSAYATKLLANLLWFGQVIAVTEVLLLGSRLGLDPSALAGVLAEGPGGSEFLVNDVETLLRGDPMAQFDLARIVEELRHLRSLAEEKNVPFALSEVVVRIHESALERFGPREGELLASRYLQEIADRRL